MTVHFIKSTWDLSKCHQFIESAKLDRESKKWLCFLFTTGPANLFCGSHLPSCYATCAVGTALPLQEVYLFKNCLPLLTQTSTQSCGISSSNSPPTKFQSLFCTGTCVRALSSNSTSSALEGPCESLSPASHHENDHLRLQLDKCSTLSTGAEMEGGRAEENVLPTFQIRALSNSPVQMDGERLCIAEVWTHHRLKALAGWTGGITFIHHTISMGKCVKFKTTDLQMILRNITHLETGNCFYKHL